MQTAVWLLQVIYKQNKEDRESYACKFCEILKWVFLQFLTFNINVTTLFQKWMPCCIQLFLRIQSHLGSPYSPADHRSGHKLESLQLKETGRQDRQRSIPGFEKPPNATGKVSYTVISRRDWGKLCRWCRGIAALPWPTFYSSNLVDCQLTFVERKGPEPPSTTAA